MARKFLYFVAAGIVLVLLTLLTLRLWSTQLSRVAFVPQTRFEAQPRLAANVYDAPAMWLARPDLRDNPALFVPTGYTPQPAMRPYATFFIHPTSYLDKGHWNAPLDDPIANDRAALFVRGQASVFAASPEVWAPRYRQAAFGAFLTDDPAAKAALDLAYRDILQAFDAFLAAIPSDMPIVLAGHSQGSLHLTRLLKERVAGTPLARRIVAAYVVGWPVGVTSDLPALGLPACAAPAQTGCILSWMSFGEPAETHDFTAKFAATPSYTGRPRAGDRALCVNPLTGSVDGVAAASANLGTLQSSLDFTTGSIVPGLAPARCDDKGFLLIGPGPNLGPYLLPGNNYHVYDYSLFWANTRADVARRVAAFGTASAPASQARR